MADSFKSRNDSITGLILAGGLAQRMGGADKGLRLLRGKPLAAHAIERLAPQVATLLINANRNPEAYAAFGYPVIADVIAGYAGPLAGLHAGLSRCATPLLATAPCDSPFLPLDLVARLHAVLTTTGAQLAVAHSADRTQPVFALYRRELLEYLNAFMADGGRKINAWHATLKIAEVSFPDAAAFANINTPEELEKLEAP
ncbi:MAG: molybdenum cofactor guanylyltransferase MobA [Betaproteobacteria bacterium]|nr:molybdenum cofactor guanylyltransferase MobA [Betaproteobacteria bacterium]